MAYQQDVPSDWDGIGYCVGCWIWGQAHDHDAETGWGGGSSSEDTITEASYLGERRQHQRVSEDTNGDPSCSTEGEEEEDRIEVEVDMRTIISPAPGCPDQAVVASIYATTAPRSATVPTRSLIILPGFLSVIVHLKTSSFSIMANCFWTFGGS
ncbi:uncharacterized protein PV07_02106 [Cladophialophora immunda]|uniref:Uncharacterized protein n=1 Tax=Cladophialophora immunda TaxID=569365 RepID=A0A0D2CWD0_9EURO|nr:uncharacterized protein PV07_02106 [Cladophialophora immunda]KIW35408.1 hypothetical protein PV07_02106 [Cladophialophora immunda]